MTDSTKSAVQRFNNLSGLMNPATNGLYVRYEDHIAALSASSPSPSAREMALAAMHEGKRRRESASPPPPSPVAQQAEPNNFKETQCTPTSSDGTTPNNACHGIGGALELATTSSGTIRQIIEGWLDLEFVKLVPGQCVPLQTSAPVTYPALEAIFESGMQWKNAASASVDCIGLALDLETQARRVESQTTERAMMAAAHGLRLLSTQQSEVRGVSAAQCETCKTPRACEYHGCVVRPYSAPGADFDAWQQNPYTKVLMKSIDEDYQPKVAPGEMDGAPSGKTVRLSGEEIDAIKDRFFEPSDAEGTCDGDIEADLFRKFARACIRAWRAANTPPQASPTDGGDA